ncbi:MAG: PEP/pyruvate-binding domain-containing protein [Anaerotruncus sp.]|nr:PEP/pyruvate-binding domain-containing protein [Anaerotruncus sp.]
MPGFVVPLSSRRARDERIAGGKGAGLARLLKSGFPVPAGFVVTTAAFREPLSQAAARAGSPDLVLGPDSDPDPAALEAARRACLSWPMPERLRRSVLAAYRRLGAGPVAVRSSLVGEDSGAASFAGQLDTVLGVDGESALLDAVRRVLASAFGDRLWAYMRQSRTGSGAPIPGSIPASTPLSALSLAVVVQRMVPAVVSGVAFSVDPVTASPGAVIEACRRPGRGPRPGPRPAGPLSPRCARRARRRRPRPPRRAPSRRTARQGTRRARPRRRRFRRSAPGRRVGLRRATLPHPPGPPDLVDRRQARLFPPDGLRHGPRCRQASRLVGQVRAGHPQRLRPGLRRDRRPDRDRLCADVGPSPLARLHERHRLRRDPQADRPAAELLLHPGPQRPGRPPQAPAAPPYAPRAPAPCPVHPAGVAHQPARRAVHRGQAHGARCLSRRRLGRSDARGARRPVRAHPGASQPLPVVRHPRFHQHARPQPGPREDDRAALARNGSARRHQGLRPPHRASSRSRS